MMDKPPLTDSADAATQRRAHERRHLYSPAKLLLASKRIVDVRAVNVSAGGAALIAPENLPIETGCEIRLDLPTTSAAKLTLYMKAVVVNTVFSSREDGFKTGLKFTHATAEQLARLNEFVRSGVCG